MIADTETNTGDNPTENTRIGMDYMDINGQVIIEPPQKQEGTSQKEK